MNDLEERIKRLERELPREVLYQNQRAPIFVDLSAIMDEVQRNRSELMTLQRNLSKLRQDMQEALKERETQLKNLDIRVKQWLETKSIIIAGVQEQIDRLEERIKGMELMGKFLELDMDQLARFDQAMRYLEKPPEDDAEDKEP